MKSRRTPLRTQRWRWALGVGRVSSNWVKGEGKNTPWREDRACAKDQRWEEHGPFWNRRGSGGGWQQQESRASSRAPVNNPAYHKQYSWWTPCSLPWPWCLHKTGLEGLRFTCPWGTKWMDLESRAGPTCSLLRVLEREWAGLGCPGGARCVQNHTQFLPSRSPMWSTRLYKGPEKHLLS